jgi:RHS repeat-associated protein
VRVNHVHLGDRLVAELAQPVAGGATTTTYVHTDLLGSPAKTSDAAGAPRSSRRHAPFGVSLDGVADGVDYTGHVADLDTGLVYAQQRYYDPLIGRFLSMDPVRVDVESGANFNAYAYANNNPYRFTDPDGRETNPITGGHGISDDQIRRNASNPNVGKFGQTRSRNNGRNGFHGGLDALAREGTPLKAPISGVVRVTEASGNPDGGNAVWVTRRQDGHTVVIGIAHLQRLDVRDGDVVQEGAVVLGMSGKTGNARNMPPEEEHAHISVRVDGQLVDPQQWFNDHPPSPPPSQQDPTQDN